MRRIVGRAICILFAMSFLAGTGRAGILPTLYAGTGVSTLGITAEGGFRFGDLGARVIGNYFSYDGNHSVDGISYHGTLALRSVGAAVDCYPLSFLGLRLSAGFLETGNSLTGTATPTSSITIGGATYTVAEAGTLNVKVKYKNKIAPYVGIGYMFDVGSSLSITPQIGIVDLGKSDVSLTSTSSYVTAADLAQERETIARDANKLSIYPVVSVTLSYRI